MKHKGKCADVAFMSRALQTLAAQGTRLTPQEVIAGFGELFSKAGAATRTVGGRIGFCIHGAGGGRWIVDLSEPGGVWSEVGQESGQEAENKGAFAACEVRIYAFARIFAALLLDPEAIVGLRETGEVVVEGDRSKLKQMARLIGSGGSLVGVRAAGG